ncbi:MAG TPA: phosphate signaling complex protein PhoU [Holophagaceae bacterium]|nr:phosphate signaling complex protein PhoU [Holophagaceae bacterium]
MTRHFQDELKELREGLMAMAGQVEWMLDLTLRALLERSDDLADRVAALDEAVDEQELKLDHLCIDLLALGAPVARDLRLVASTLKIIPELERIGDHCSNIARRSKLLNPQPTILAGDSLERMGLACRTMVKQSVDAFVNGDASLARTVIDSDDLVDQLYTRTYGELIRLMLADPLCIERASHLILVIKNWERIADQATNIAEEVLFILEGRNVKHSYLQERH